MALRSLTVAHAARFGFNRLVEEGLKIFARKAMAAYGGRTATMREIRCDRRRLDRLLSPAGKALPELRAREIWSPGDIRGKTIRQAKREIETALVRTAISLRSRRAIARFYKVDESRIRRLFPLIG